MIKKIIIANEASYPADGVTIEPKPINYIFGTNGTGKTTISRVIASKEKPESYAVTWDDNHPLDVFVYNRDFIEDNFASQMNGVFTLGAAEKSTVEELQTKNAERSRNQDELTGLDNTLSTKQEEWGENLDQFKDVCWQQKKTYEDEFRAALRGSMNSKAIFCQKVLAEHATNNADLLSLEALRQKARVLFSESVAKVEPITTPDFSALSQILSNSVWQKHVAGSSDIGIATLIDRLENSDWVGQGRKYLDQSEDACPFCQQGLPHDFRDQLERYFGGEFAEDTKLINNLINQHEEQCRELLAPLESLSIDQKASLQDDFEQLLGALRQKFEDNHRRLNQKAEGPSQQIKPDDIQGFCDKVLEALNIANQKF